MFKIRRIEYDWDIFICILFLVVKEGNQCFSEQAGPVFSINGAAKANLDISFSSLDYNFFSLISDLIPDIWFSNTNNPAGYG